MKYALLIMLLFFSGCGFEARNSELIGQIKKVGNATPLICDNFNYADISLGVMRNGVGSMSTQDIELYIQSDSDLNLFKKAVSTGQLIKVRYDVRRVTFCTPDHWVTGIEFIK